MSNPNTVVLPVILLLVSTSVFSHKSLVFGSPVPEQSFERPDPLCSFKLYHGGYDIRNKHYWASAAFTGIHGFAIAGVWMLCGLGFGSYILWKTCSGGSSQVIYHPDSFYLIMFSLVALFTFLAIVATGIIMAANQRSRQLTNRLKETILGVGGDARLTIQKVNLALGEMETLLGPYDPNICRLLNSTMKRLRRESRDIWRFVKNSKQSSEQAIQILYVANLVVVTVNLSFLVAAFVLLFFHWHPGFFFIILFCWILTTLSWMLTGFDFFFHTFAEDTCSAFEDFEQNPQNNSLSSMLSCAKSPDSDKILVRIGYTVHSFITELNSKVGVLQELLQLDAKNDLSKVMGICDPFSGPPNYSYTAEKCPKDDIPIGDLQNVLSRFTCFKYKQNSTGNCEDEGRIIPESYYAVAWAYSRSIQSLINVFPELQSLAQCSSVKEALSYVILHQCKPFRASVRMLWASMLCLSIFMVALSLVWIAKAKQEKGRCFSMFSILPNPTAAAA